MTSLPALDQAVREVTTPTERLKAFHGQPLAPSTSLAALYVLIPRIRARYHKIMEAKGE